jgi:hypothetical protein
MATVTLTFTANPATIKIPYPSGGQKEYSNTTNHLDPVVRAIADEWAANGTTTGTVVIEAS